MAKKRNKQKQEAEQKKEAAVAPVRKESVVPSRTQAKATALKQQPSHGHTHKLIMQPKLKQNLLMLKAQDQVAAMLHQIAEPTTSLLIRTKDPSSITPEGTALAKLTSTFDIEWGPRETTLLYPTIDEDIFNNLSTSSTPMFGDRAHFGAILTRSPIVPLITREENKAQVSVPIYEVTTRMGSNPNNAADEGKIFIPITGLQHQSGDAVYGSFVPNCLHGDVSGVWLDSSTAPNQVDTATSMTISLRSINGVGANDLYVSLVQMGASNMKERGSQPFPSVVAGSITTVTLPVFDSGYYAIRLTHDQANAEGAFDSLRIVVSVNTAFVMRHHTLTDRSTLTSFVRNARVNGSSLLIKNRSPVIVQGGTAYAVQLPGSVAWYDSFKDLSKFTETNVSNRWMGDWSKGAYGFVMPQGSEGGNSPFAMNRVVVDADWQNPQQQVQFNFDPWNMGGMVAYMISPPVSSDPSNEQYSSANATLQVCQALEYSTTQQLVNVARSAITHDEYGCFLDALSELPQFYENSVHLRDIWRIVKNVSQKVVEWTPHVIKVASGLSDFASVIAAL